MSRLKEKYQKEVVPAMIEAFGYKSTMAVPRLEKVILNMGLGESIYNIKVLDKGTEELSFIAGQKAIITKAKRSIAGFKLREGMPIGCMVTLRRDMMYDFLDKLMNTVLCRIREFQGVPRTSFDGRGNYTLGFRVQTVFPEIEYDQIDHVRGLELSILTTARTDEEGRQLLELMGMPFATE